MTDNKTTTTKTKVRYAVHYNERNYEYVLHSEKRHFLRNIADVINVLEYCIVQDLKKELYTPSEKLYNFNVIRLVNDEPEDNGNSEEFNATVKAILEQIVKDNIQRYK